MKLRNPFSQETRILYLYRYDCDNCGSNQSLELHHNVGRDSNSPLNAVLICRECHEHIKQGNKILFTKNLAYLYKINYKIIPKDMEFLEKHKKLLDNNKELDKWLKN